MPKNSGLLKNILLAILIIGTSMSYVAAQNISTSTSTNPYSPAGQSQACFYAAPLASGQSSNPCPYVPTISIAMHPGTVLGTIHKALLGENLNTWRQSSAMHQVIGQAYASPPSGIGITSIRWPGGSSANGVNWQDYTTPPTGVPNYNSGGLMPLQCTGVGTTGEYPQEPTGDLTSVMNNIVNPNNMDLFLQINYGEYSPPGVRQQTCNTVGSPSYAAQELNYAYSQNWNVFRLEIGNEEYGNDSQDNHTVANGYSNGPGNGITYATAEPGFYSALHAVATAAGKPLQVCIGVTGSRSPNYHNFDTVELADLGGSNVDCVDLHYYPLVQNNTNTITDANLIAAPVYGFSVNNVPYNLGIAADVQYVRNELIQYNYCTSPCSSFPIYVGEWNIIGGGPPPATNSIVDFIFTLEMLGEMSTANVAGAYQWETVGCYVGNTSLYPGNLFGAFATNYGFQQDFASDGPITSVIPAPVATATAIGAASLGNNSSETNCTTAYGVKETYPFGTILPNGRAFQMMSQSGFATEGASSVAIDNQSGAGIHSYASVSSGKYVAIYINTNEYEPININATIDGVLGSSGYSTITYSKSIYDYSVNNGPFLAPVSATHGIWTTSIPITVPAWGAVALTVNTP
jgi:hypothetical protein